MNPSNPASTPSTFPATVKIPASPTQSAEEEAGASLLMLAEAADVEEEFDLADEEYHAVHSPISSAGSSNIKAVYVHSVALDDDMVKDPEDSTDEDLDGKIDGECPEAKVEELKVEADPLIMPEERMCNARGWNCGKPAQSGSTMCSKHVKTRDELLKKFQAKRLQASTGSDPINVPKTQE